MGGGVHKSSFDFSKERDSLRGIRGKLAFAGLFKGIDELTGSW
jgi:hypothetical protein